LSKDIKVDSISVGDTLVNNDGITISKGNSDGQDVRITKNGLNNGGNRVTNVAPGIDGTDAVNVSQLKQLGGNINNQINKVDSNARAGVAQAMATAGLPQAYLPGKSMMAFASGRYRGEMGYAIGYSTISDGGNWVLKASASGNSRGSTGVTLGVGYQW
jgi:autotransporter adhesin